MGERTGRKGREKRREGRKEINEREEGEQNERGWEKGRRRMLELPAPLPDYIPKYNVRQQ